MSHVRIDYLQRAARQAGYAVPHMLGGTVEMAVGQLRAAEARQSPFALGFAPGVFYMIPMEVGLPMMVAAARYAKVPVATQLEHGHDFDTIMKAIRLGVSSVMFDGSELPYEENVARTSEVVRVAHTFDVAVEAELGYVGGSVFEGVETPSSRLTDPEAALDFVRRTGVDTLAISFGNVHGKYHSLPQLDYERVRKISSLVDVPLVMHGGSGLTEDEYRRVIAAGISNIHFYTRVASGVWGELQRVAGGDQVAPMYHTLVERTCDHFYREALSVIDMLGSAGRAGAFQPLVLTTN